jgi:hypothetical protein
MIELRLQRGQALAVDVDRLKDFAQQYFQALETLIERALGTDAIPDGLIRGTGLVDGCGATLTHGRAF